MVLFSISIAAAALFLSPRPAKASQAYLHSPSAQERKLHGRFIHITDMHPDSYYVPGASISSSCHSEKPRSELKRAGRYGAPGTDCDTPVSLVNMTLDWVEKEWADKIDFVIWTGDNARHDTDSSLPRTPSEIRDMNREIASKMHRIFTPRGVAVVPSIGNNDIWPHNIMYEGPSTVTNDFLESWRSFVPFPAYQVFQRGVYFSTELVPNKLAAISLNTLYWFDSNKAVDGCPKKGNDPGSLELDWLEVQLKMYRSRRMQVWLTGHVAPTTGDYFPRCYARYGELALRYQDTILGHLFGHKNVDHFILHSIDDVLAARPSMRIMGRKKEILIADHLHSEFKALSRKKKIDYDDYYVVNIGPSVIPEYTPSVRIYTYNTTNADGSLEPIVIESQDELDSDSLNSFTKVDCSKKENKRHKKCVFKKPRHANKHSPSRRNTLWSPTGYSQFYIPESSWANKSHSPQFELEYVTYSLATLRANASLVPEHLLPPELRGGPIETLSKSRYAPYGLRDLTIPSWIKFARKLGEKKHLWKRFREAMFLETSD